MWTMWCVAASPLGADAADDADDAQQPREPAGRVYFCGGPNVLGLDVQAVQRDPAARLWTWTASDSPQIADEHRTWFTGLDECKPVAGGQAVLVCSSWESGVALIRVADKACLFYAKATNAHSADLIGSDLVGVALSSGGDVLRLYPLARPTPLAAAPAWEMPLTGGHGVVWDDKRQALWALGDTQLLKLSVARADPVSAEVVGRWDVPGGNGHDLFPWDPTRLVVSAKEGAYLFDIETGAFEPQADLPRTHKIKSVNRHMGTGTVMYTEGEPTFTEQVRFVGWPSLRVPGMRGYKARRHVPMDAR